ncbi:MAG: LuxR C-terminal-related transcriptional regulator [Actinomycetes bacterium]
MTGSGLAQPPPPTSRDGESGRFETSETENARTAEALSAAPDPLAFQRIASAELQRLQELSGARSVHLIVAWGARVEQRVLLHGPAETHDDRRMLAGLLATPSWHELVPDGTVASFAPSDVPPAVSSVLADRGVATVWVVGGARSMPGTSHAVFVFADDVEPLSELEAASLRIRCSVLISRAIVRLAGFEWDQLASDPDDERSSYSFATDHEGLLLRWPFPLVGVDRRLERQVDADDRRPLLAAVDALLAGSMASYEVVVHHADGHPSHPMRLMMRRARTGGIDGIVLPPDLPVAALPNHLLERLTQREQEVVRLIAEGLRVRQVGERLFLSQHTVRNHLKSVFAKLSVSSQADLISLVNDPRSVVVAAD